MQKFIECCIDPICITKLLDKIKNKLFLISTNCYGTRVFQKILEHISQDQDYEMIREYLKNNVYNLIKDTNGNHVIQKLIQIYPMEKNSFIINEILENIAEISKLKQGSCIFQKIIDHANASDKVNLKNIINFFQEKYNRQNSCECRFSHQ
jgi:hypothetical protein